MCETQFVANNIGSGEDLSDAAFYSRLQWRASCKQEWVAKVYYNLLFPITQCLIPPLFPRWLSTTGSQPTRRLLLYYICTISFDQP